MNFKERCNVCESCIPDSQFKDQMVKLHEEMLARIEKLENTKKVIIGQYKIISDENREGTIICSGKWPAMIDDAGFTGKWMELAFTPLDSAEKVAKPN